jgi:hypothetical protein
MDRRFSLYSSNGTCWNPHFWSGRDASLAPKNTVTAAGDSASPLIPAIALSRILRAHRVLYPLYPLRITSTWLWNKYKWLRWWDLIESINGDYWSREAIDLLVYLASKVVSERSAPSAFGEGLLSDRVAKKHQLRPHLEKCLQFVGCVLVCVCVWERERID